MSETIRHPWEWPAPFPRLWAYGTLFVIKATDALIGPERVHPDRKHGEKRVWDKIVHFWSRDPTRIPGTNIFLGSAKNAADSNGLHRNNIRLVINATADVPNFFEGRNDNIRYIRVPLEDVDNAELRMDLFESCVLEIDSVPEGNVLVHCMMGASRSAAVVCYYLMKHNGWTMRDTYDKVSAWRPAVTMNVSFYDRLTALNDGVPPAYIDV